MCLYWKKLHTCDHTSDRPYIEMCRPGCLSNTVCPDIAEDPNPRPSHFPCWLCIKAEARADAEAIALADQKAAIKAQEAQQWAMRERQATELKAKEEKIRREARERAAREREEELRIKREKEEEERRAKKEGGPWIETGSGGGKKGKAKKSGVYTGPSTPTSGPSVTVMAAFKDKKENDTSKESPKKDKRSSHTGRAGTWGPPKKILSRVENGVGGA